MGIDTRFLEKTDKFGFMFYISYQGNAFHSFDEVSGKESVKSTFAKIITSFGFTWAKGIQQAGRTDAKVSANENILYVSSRYRGDVDKLKNSFNSVSKDIKIKRVVKTLPNLAFPEEIVAREYIYALPSKKITNSLEVIEERCRECSGRYDVSRFTDKKGLELKEHIRSVEVTFREGKLYFKGDSFMPKQVRIMASYILTDSYEPLPGKYLTLDRVILKDELLNMSINNNNIILDKYRDSEYQLSVGELFLQPLIPLIINVERLGDNLNIFYVKEGSKANFIGKNGVISKKMKRVFGNLLIKE